MSAQTGFRFGLIKAGERFTYCGESYIKIENHTYHRLDMVVNAVRLFDGVSTRFDDEDRVEE